MTDRSAAMQAFLAKAGWGAATRKALAGDASNRRYDRLVQPDGATAVLMDAPPDRGEDIRPFVQIADFLSGCGLSAPEILAQDAPLGALLLEDLGDALFARLLPQDPGREPMLYEAAVDLLVHLHRYTPPTLETYDAPRMSSLAALALEWYAAGSGNAVSQDDVAAFRAELETILTLYAAPTGVLIQRDYHAENLLWLPDRQGVARVGLLDFQDAMIGHPAYDLVSLLEDARRDVAPELADAMLARYVTATGADPDRFGAAYAVLGAQRNLRILGVFARLSLHFGKPAYVDLIPRVWGHLQNDLAHPALATLGPIVARALPPPTPDILLTLKAKCGTIPHL